MLTILKQIFYIPLYNAFVLLLNIPGIDAGLAVVIFTVIVKVALFPLQKKALLAQIKLKEIEPKIKKMKAEIKDQREQGIAMMKLYKENGINPLSSLWILLIQLPIVISLYHIFASGQASTISMDILYPFIHSVASVPTLFFGVLDITHPNIIAALLGALTQFIQGQFQPIPPAAKKTNGSQNYSLPDDLARSMGFQVRYTMPVIIFLVTFKLPSVIALYFIASNIFMIFQELALRPHRKKLTQLGQTN